jgi:beta-galactosidase
VTGYSSCRNDLSFVKIEVIDSNGQVVPKDSISVKLIISGNGELIASGNANPKDMAGVNRPQMDTYKGKAIAIIRPKSIGTIKIIAESMGMKAGELTIKVEK